MSESDDNINIEWICVHGHDRCDQMYPGPDCPYCERKESDPQHLTEEGHRAFGSMSAYLKFKAWLDSLVENAKATREKPAKEYFDVQPPGDDPQKIG